MDTAHIIVTHPFAIAWGDLLISKVFAVLLQSKESLVCEFRPTELLPDLT